MMFALDRTIVRWFFFFWKFGALTAWNLHTWCNTTLNHRHSQHIGERFTLLWNEVFWCSDAFISLIKSLMDWKNSSRSAVSKLITDGRRMIESYCEKMWIICLGFLKWLFNFGFSNDAIFSSIGCNIISNWPTDFCQRLAPNGLTSRMLISAIENCIQFLYEDLDLFDYPPANGWNIATTTLSIRSSSLKIVAICVYKFLMTLISLNRSRNNCAFFGMCGLPVHGFAPLFGQNNRVNESQMCIHESIVSTFSPRIWLVWIELIFQMSTVLRLSIHASITIDEIMFIKSIILFWGYECGKRHSSSKVVWTESTNSSKPFTVLVWTVLPERMVKKEVVIQRDSILMSK